MNPAAAALFVLLLAVPAEGRDLKVRREFIKQNPCPATGKTAPISKTGDTRCAGFVVDHVIPLCLGGPDIVENLKWQTTTESYLKDIFERDMCAMKRKLEKPPLLVE